MDLTRHSPTEGVTVSEKYNWLDDLPVPLQAATSYDPGELRNAGLHARLTVGPRRSLPPGQPLTCPVLHWWTGTLGRPARNGRGRCPTPAVALLAPSGAVYTVWDWPSANNWLDFVLGLDPRRLREGPLLVRAEASREPALEYPVWRFTPET